MNNAIDFENKSGNAIVPEHVFSAPGITPRAHQVWVELAKISSPKKPQVWIRQENLAKNCKCTIRTIHRSLQCLMDAGLLHFTGRRKEGRYKYYELQWAPPKKKDSPDQTKKPIF